jgi:molybdenum cofactor cytidylyltransferase
LKKFSSIILAAGESARMGEIKQLLVWRGKSLLEHAVDAARGAGIERIVVVYGAHVEKIRPEIIRLGTDCIHNEDWKFGVGTSIRKGVAHVLATAPITDGILIQLADQPRVTQEGLLAILLKGKQQSVTLVASEHGESLGVPALFSSAHFSELLALPDNAGAKSIFYRHLDKLITIKTAESNEDIDTPEHYVRLNQ